MRIDVAEKLNIPIIQLHVRYIIMIRLDKFERFSDFIVVNECPECNGTSIIKFDFGRQASCLDEGCLMSKSKFNIKIIKINNFVDKSN